MTENEHKKVDTLISLIIFFSFLFFSSLSLFFIYCGSINILDLMDSIPVVSVLDKRQLFFPPHFESSIKYGASQWLQWMSNEWKIDVICFVVYDCEQHVSNDAMSATCRSRRTKTLDSWEIRSTTSTGNQIMLIGHSTKKHSSL